MTSDFALCFKPLVARKKSIPAPILIPDSEFHVPGIQRGHSDAPRAIPAGATSQPNADNASLNPPSPSASDNLSVISGTTLPGTLIASSFLLVPNERRSLRHRSGLTRKDSATLPRRESVFTSDSGRSSPVPPVPPVPVLLARVPSNPNHSSTIKSGASTESEYPMSDSYITSPEVVTSSEIRRRISRQQEDASHAASTSADKPPLAVSDVAPKEKAVPAHARVVKDGVFDVPTTGVEVPLPINSQETTRQSPQGGSCALSSDDHSLDEFEFMSPEPLVVIASPGSDSSASYTAPLPKRNDTKRRRRIGGSNFLWNGCATGSFSGFMSDSENFS